MTFRLTSTVSFTTKPLQPVLAHCYWPQCFILVAPPSPSPILLLFFPKWVNRRKWQGDLSLSPMSLLRVVATKQEKEWTPLRSSDWLLIWEMRDQEKDRHSFVPLPLHDLRWWFSKYIGNMEVGQPRPYIQTALLLLLVSCTLPLLHFLLLEDFLMVREAAPSHWPKSAAALWGTPFMHPMFLSPRINHPSNLALAMQIFAQVNFLMGVLEET